jgi:DNA-binding NarL/FixJ family response regulator
METKPTQTPKRKARILLVDDHLIVRDGLAQFINCEQDLVVCGQADNARQAFEMIPALKPDLAIVDISLHGMSGMELIKNIKSMYSQLLVLVLSMHDESLYAERALRAGAKGYITKQKAASEVLAAIRRILAVSIHI